MINAEAGLACGTDDVDEGEAVGVGGYGFGYRIVVGGDDVVGGFRRMFQRGLPFVVVGLVDGALERKSSALIGSGMVGRVGEDGAVRGQRLEAARVGRLKRNAGAGVGNHLAQDERGG